VLTLQKADSGEIVSVSTAEKSIDELLSKEWLLTNDRGGYASSTVIGCNTRRYHGLLVGSLNPPVDRIVALANCLEMVIVGTRTIGLATFEFDEKFAPESFKRLKRFRRDIGVHFEYELDGVELTKSIYLLRHSDTVAVVYDFSRVKNPVDFAVRPLVALRDFHTLQKSYARLNCEWADDGLVVRHDTTGSCQLYLCCPSAKFEKDPEWWFNFFYRKDKERGQDFSEDLWTPGFFKWRVDRRVQLVFYAALSGNSEPDRPTGINIKALRENLCKHQDAVTPAAKGRDEKLRTLCLAAEQFVVKRSTGAPADVERTTILAGFPWFADWGRDAFIALPGLLLSTGRYQEAKSVLTTFAAAADKGMIPNRFDDRSDTAYFNSVDASLWFVKAAFEYLAAARDSETFTQQLLPKIRWIADSYHDGTRFNIHADEDGLITGGTEQTQLTWMDAKYEGLAFTPRYGKAVEVNALWYNCLCYLAQFYAETDPEAAKHYHLLADHAESGFRQFFWNERTGYLNDCILPDGTVDTSLRPNQIFAVSLAFSPLPPEQQKAVVNVVREKLLTPYGLRTLSPGDSRYKGTYTGPQKQRDAAYHQGTVWPYLIGPFVEAYLKVNDFSRESREKAAGFIEPLLRHMTEDACLGSISEIFDADEPHKPKGCIAQAWSVAELIRAYLLIHS